MVWTSFFQWTTVEQSVKAINAHRITSARRSKNPYPQGGILKLDASHWRFEVMWFLDTSGWSGWYRQRSRVGRREQTKCSEICTCLRTQTHFRLSHVGDKRQQDIRLRSQVRSVLDRTPDRVNSRHKEKVAPKHTWSDWLDFRSPFPEVWRWSILTKTFQWV